MSSTSTEAVIMQVTSGVLSGVDDAGDQAAWIVKAYISTVREKPASTLLGVYPVFLCVGVALALFFLASLVLALTSQYFLDWGSALIGFLGSAGLAVVGWFSALQLRK